MQETAIATGQEKELQEDPGTGLLIIDERSIQMVKRQVMLMERAISETLIEGIDYGTVKGIALPFLFDPGASKVRDMFNCYPQHEILAKETEGGLLTIFMRVELISRRTKEVIASGVGAATAEEKKYRYIWVEDPADYGYEVQECQKKKTQWGLRYRILNPDIGDLKNTILKMAAKRGEVDSSNNLPGVASAMAKIKKGWALATNTDTGPEWASFWGKLKTMGINQGDAHLICQVKSFQEWLDAGKTLDEAIQICQDIKTAKMAKKAIDDTFGDGGSSPKETKPAKKAKVVDELPPIIEEGEFTEEPAGEVVKAMEKEMEEAEEVRQLVSMDTSKITTSAQFYKACFDSFKLQPKDALPYGR